MWYLLTLLLLVWALPAHAATYYLKPSTGSDANPGTLASPWKTMPKVKSTAVAGDTINVLAGSYTQAQMEPGGGVPAWTNTQAHGTAGSPITFQANPGDTVTFTGGGLQYWQYFEPSTGPVSGTAHPRYIIIKDIHFTGYAGAVMTIGSSTHIAILNCTFVSSPTYTAGVPITIIYSNHVVLRDLTISNVGSHLIYISDGASNLLIERVYGTDGCYYGLHGWGHGDYTLTAKNVILRNNTLVNIHSAGTIASGGNFENLYIYNNTFYQEANPCPSLYPGAAGGSMVSFHLTGNRINTHVVNNVGYGYAGVAPVYSDAVASFNGSLFLDYNLWTNLTLASKVYFWDNVSYSLASFQAATTFEDHSLVANPLFVDPAGRNFQLQSSSPAIDAGTFLTTAVGSGSGTALTVADAGFFIDGFTLVTGDTIQIGAQSPVEVTSINYTSNVMTLAASRTWSAGDPVSLPYFGTKPDMGSQEFPSAPPAAGPRNMVLVIPSQ